MMTPDILHIAVFYDPRTLDHWAIRAFGDVTNDLAPSMNIIYLRLKGRDTDGTALRELLKVPGVIHAEYNMVMRNAQRSITLNDNMAARNDKIYQELNLYNAWEITKGDPRIKIGITDSGVDMAHPDINCVPGGIFCNGISTVNGHYPIRIDIDSVIQSYGFTGDAATLTCFSYDPNWLEITKTGSLQPATLYADATCTNTVSNVLEFLQGESFWVSEPVVIYVEPLDSVAYFTGSVGMMRVHDGFGHGTAIAGLISSPHNGNGFAGIAPDCETRMYKWTDDWYAGGTFDSTAAVVKAADDGCHVITMSWGGPTSTALMQNAMQYAYNKGAILIGSSGNKCQFPYVDSDSDAKDYPAAYPEVIGVGSCGWNDPTATGTNLDNEPSLMDFSRLSPFAEKFAEVDIVAPGWGWIFHAPTQHAMMWYGYRFNSESKHYSFMSDGGTSFSNPATGAVIALCMSKKLAVDNNTAPTIPLNQIPWTQTSVRGWLSSGAKGPVKLPNGTTTATKGFGAGRLDAMLALGAVV